MMQEGMEWKKGRGWNEGGKVREGKEREDEGIIMEEGRKGGNERREERRMREEKGREKRGREGYRERENKGMRE